MHSGLFVSVTSYLENRALDFFKLYIKLYLNETKKIPSRVLKKISGL